ncbi:MAG: lipoate--protein ligase [Desulfovibrio sp.]|jgi:lipoate-protein ligase A|nr:lipoate--protein ligase [Desulfovibrio sp.]
MMYYIESASMDPYFNLALEQYVFDRLDRRHEYFMLWRNRESVIVGRHQNTAAEINGVYVREHAISVVRRLSGGGAVYHDPGNVNFTFIVNAGGLGAFDFASFCRPVVAALARLGVEAEINGRNDMTIQGRKFSGNAQYRKQGRIMHHGTILYDLDLGAAAKALKPPEDKLESKGLKSVRSRIANVKSQMPGNASVEDFIAALRESMFQEYQLVPYELSPADLDGVKALRDGVYATWDWNYGASPAYAIVKERRVEGCGKLEIHMNVDRGVIRDIAFFGDYFGNEDSSGLAALLRGQPPEREALAPVLAKAALGEYFYGLDADRFLDILLE